MCKKFCVAIGLAMVLTTISGIAYADTLLGKNYVGGSFGILKFGDDQLDEIFGNARSCSVFGNINLNTNIDLQVSVGYAWADGKDYDIEIEIMNYVVDADVVYFFRPNEKINPYIGGGITHVQSEIKNSFYGKNDDTNIGVGTELGIEFDYSEELLFNFGVNYFHIEDEDSSDINAGVSSMVKENIRTKIRGSYDFDSGDAAASVSLILML